MLTSCKKAVEEPKNNYLIDDPDIIVQSMTSKRLSPTSVELTLYVPINKNTISMEAVSNNSLLFPNQVGFNKATDNTFGGTKTYIIRVKKNDGSYIYSQPITVSY